LRPDNKNWEKVLQEIDTRIQSFAGLCDQTVFDQAVKDLTVARRNVVAALAKVRALQLVP
jgi:hypothetical protein